MLNVDDNLFIFFINSTEIFNIQHFKHNCEGVGVGPFFMIGTIIA